jgi:hypothetical protein
MLTRLCRFRLPSQPRLHNIPKKRGQVIVIFGVTLLAMIFFAGLAIDAGSLYVTYGQLRRAIDAAAVAAANDYKSEGVGVVAPPLTRMTNAAMEVMKLHNLNEAEMDLRVYVCDSDGDRVRDAALQGQQPLFYDQCPDTAGGDSARKLVWIDATQSAPVYFLSLIGFPPVPLRANAIAEAAPIDLVIVIDTSESMASETSGFVSGNFNPSTCNSSNNCEPMHAAKVAAKDLIDTLYDGYDHVAIVNFDVMAKPLTSISMRDVLSDAKSDVDALQVRDDPPIVKIWDSWYFITQSGDVKRGFNPVYPEDRDGNGLDDDPGLPCSLTSPIETAPRWDATVNTFSLDENGTPCDNSAKLDSYDWDGNGVYTDNDDVLANQWLIDHGCDLVNNPSACRPIWTYFSPNSTCTGCGIRVGAEVLKRDGRPNSVWVMVFLSDGLVNLSDTPTTNSNIPSGFANGYCNGGIGSFMWGNYCSDTRKDANLSPRYCLKSDPATCPPGSISALGNTADYSVYDYALDMVDFAALQRSTNPNELERAGSDIAIYSIGLGDAGDTPAGASGPIGEYLLRYVAAVGDDGDRTTNPCVDTFGVHEAPQTSCGQYYYAPSGSGLRAIFNEISTRIYSRLTK